MEQYVIPLLIAEFVTMLFLIFKTYPSMQTKVSQLEDNDATNVLKIDANRELINKQNIAMAEIKTEISAFKKEYNDNKEGTKEILKEVKKSIEENRKCVEDNTRAITSLEIYLKHISNAHRHNDED